MNEFRCAGALSPEVIACVPPRECIPDEQRPTCECCGYPLRDSLRSMLCSVVHYSEMSLLRRD